MNITLVEAVALLETWKEQGTELQVSISRPGVDQKFSAKVEAIRGEVIELNGEGGTTEVSLAGAEFNGDRRAGPRYAAYLVCEFRNGDRCAFYAPRATAK